MAAPDPGVGGPPEFTPAQVEFLEGQFARRTAEQVQRITAALAGQIATQSAQLREEAAKAQSDLRQQQATAQQAAATAAGATAVTEGLQQTVQAQQALGTAVEQQLAEAR